MVRQKEPFVLGGLNGGMTVADTKTELARAMFISVRKAKTLHWNGLELDDQKTLDAQHVREGAALELTLRARAQTELNAFRTIKHVIILDTGGLAIALEGVSNTTKPGDIKAQIKAPETATISFSPVYTANFGAPLADDKTLSSYGVLGARAHPDHPLPLTTPVQCAHTPADVRGRRCDVLSQMAMSCTIRAATRRSPRPKSPRLRAKRSRHVHGKPALTQPGALCVSIRKSLSKAKKVKVQRVFVLDYNRRIILPTRAG